METNQRDAFLRVSGRGGRSLQFLPVTEISAIHISAPAMRALLEPALAAFVFEAIAQPA
jgi:hypothetical protein